MTKVGGAVGQTVTSRARQKVERGSLEEGDGHNGTGTRLPQHRSAVDVSVRDELTTRQTKNEVMNGFFQCRPAEHALPAKNASPAFVISFLIPSVSIIVSCKSLPYSSDVYQVCSTPRGLNCAILCTVEKSGASAGRPFISFTSGRNWGHFPPSGGRMFAPCKNTNQSMCTTAIRVSVLLLMKSFEMQ